MKYWTRSRVFFHSILLLAAPACGGTYSQPDAANEPESPPVSGSETPTTPVPFGEQAALGQQLYSTHCAKCHGDAGQGNDRAPALVGLDHGALPLDPPTGAKYRTGQFKTVADIADFVVNNMPPGKGGTLTEDQYWAILAFDLKANGIDLGEQHLDGKLASTLDVPR